MRQRIPLAKDMDRKEVAQAYQEMMSRSRAPYRFWARRALKKVPFGSRRAVDIGSGPGYLLIEMAKLAPNFELYGLDNSLAMLELARENIVRAGCTDQVSLVEGTAYKMPFDDNSFDLVICTNTLHGIDDLEAFFGETYRVLKRGGFLRVHAWRRNAWSIFLKIAKGQQKQFVNSPLAGPKAVFDASYTSSEVKEVLTKIPFRRVTLRAPVAALTVVARK